MIVTHVVGNKQSHAFSVRDETTSEHGVIGRAFDVIFLLFFLVAGATKEIGTVLTRICLRHKAVEARLKTFTR